MQSITKHIPNTITLFNLFCGIIASVQGIYGQYQSALYFMIAAALFDFCDGLVARLLGAYSPLGKELDSLADMISFGLAPTLMVLSFTTSTYQPYYIAAKESGESTYLYSLIMLLPLLLAACSALRLAKFNIDTRQTHNFIGLATPASGMMIGGLMASLKEFDIINKFFYSNAYVLVIATIITALLLVSNIPMFSFKFKNLKWKENKIRFIFIIVSALFAITYLLCGLFSLSFWIFTIFLSYIIINLFIYPFHKEQRVNEVA